MDITQRRERSGRVIRVVVAGSGRGNSFTMESLTALADALSAAAANSACGVVRLDMEGPHFCSGWDTGSFAALADASVDDVAAQLRASDEVVGAIRRLPVPVVAAVRGKVIGFGVGLLAAVHLPIISEESRISLPEVRFGFAPAGVGHVLAQLLPRPQAYALLTGQSTLSGEEAHRVGLAASVVPEAELDRAVDELVDSLADLDPSALRAVVDVVESSRSTGRPDDAYIASARTIVRSAASITTKGTR